MVHVQVLHIFRFHKDSNVSRLCQYLCLLGKGPNNPLNDGRFDFDLSRGDALICPLRIMNGLVTVAIPGSPRPFAVFNPCWNGLACNPFVLLSWRHACEGAAFVAFVRRNMAAYTYQFAQSGVRLNRAVLTWSIAVGLDLGLLPGILLPACLASFGVCKIFCAFWDTHNWLREQTTGQE